MFEVKSRVMCYGEGCGLYLEYWAVLSIVQRDTSDTFQNSSISELELSAPDELESGWTREGSWTPKYFCPKCTASNLDADNERAKLIRKKGRK